MENDRRCSECGHPIPEGSAYCPDCGSKFEPDFAAPPSYPRTPPGEQKRTRGRLPIFIAIGCLGLVVVSCPVCCIVFYGIGSAIEKAEKKEAAEKIGKAESLWNGGEKAAAVEIYKDLLKNYFRHVDDDKRRALLSRVIEFDIENGNEGSARNFIRIGIERNARIEVKREEFSRLFEEVKEEIRLEEEERARQAELRRQQRASEKAKGRKPKVSEWDGSTPCVKDYLKGHLHDPGSVKYEFWSEPFEHDGYWAVRVKYRAKNRLGALVLEDKLALIQDGVVVQMIDYGG